jgi:hypothetical protein
MDRSKKIILITGGTGKLGRVFIAHFLNKGHTVIFTSRSQLRIKKLLSNFAPFKANLFGIKVNLKTDRSFEKIISNLENLEMFPDVLINNARDRDHLKLKNSIPDRNQWFGEFLLDVVVPYELSVMLAYHPKSRLRSIINISSIYGVVAANPNLYKNPKIESPIHYSIAKSALIHLTKELAVRLSDRRIRVNCVSYGGIKGRVDKAFMRRYAKLCPLGRMLNEEDVIGAVDFLISDLADGVTGHNLIVDGGWTIW